MAKGNLMYSFGQDKSISMLFLFIKWNTSDILVLFFFNRLHFNLVPGTASHFRIHVLVTHVYPLQPKKHTCILDSHSLLGWRYRHMIKSLSIFPPTSFLSQYWPSLYKLLSSTSLLSSLVRNLMFLLSFFMNFDHCELLERLVPQLKKKKQKLSPAVIGSFWKFVRNWSSLLIHPN